MAGNRWGIVGVFAFVAAITAALVYLWQSQVVAPAGPASGAFSATRAFATLSSLLKEQRPHPVGSPENAVVRDRIVAELKAAGYAPKCRRRSSASPPAAMPAAPRSRTSSLCTADRQRQSGACQRALRQRSRRSGVSDDGAGSPSCSSSRALFRQADRQRHRLPDQRWRGDRPARCTRLAERHPLMSRIGVVVNFERAARRGPR